MEPVTFAIGGAVAKWAFKLWAGDGASVDLGTDLAGIVARRIADPFQRRSVTRQFESLADEIAKRLEPYLSREITGLDEGEREAVCLAAQEAIDSSLLDVATILKLNLEPSLIKKHMQGIDPDVARRYGFSEAAESMYDTLLTEVSEYISVSANTLPGFTSQQTAELLSRDSQIISMLIEVLDKIPKSSTPTTWGSASSDLLFENEYRKTVFRYADKLQLFGVTSKLERSTYSLSVAYISMAVSANAPEDNGYEAEIPKMGSAGWKKDTADFLNVEEALGAHPYVMVSGGAGSGKTTLVQWLACSAARGTFSGTLEPWNGHVPFILPLRRFVDTALPRPEEFVAPVAEPIAGAMPHGWVHRILSAGRALILVDGLDEIPAERRVQTKEWLENIIDVFPENRFIITSRSTALSDELVDNDRFSYASLLPMEYADIKAFVAHWHAAAARDISSVEEKALVRESERLILNAIRDKSSIRSLCNSPLLCALVCALNRDRAGSIPENRMELYDTALQMLVVRRDEARRISVSDDVALSYKESEVLLRSFALWMHENGHADAEKEDFQRRVGKELESLHRISASKEDVAQHLLVRSGVLREPVPGRIDFVHRTFLEYLAAAAIVDDDSMTKLVRHGHEDYWREVIIMAAGHARSRDREELIRGLIDRGKQESALTHRLFLLAVACMETSTDLSPALQLELQRCLEQVIPPRNMTDAAAVASAGPIAIPLLANFDGNAVETAACVRALVMIGGEAALGALENFSNDSRVTVAREIIRGWSFFEADTYASRILSRSPLDHGGIRIRDAEYLRFVDKMRQVKRVFVDSQARPVDLRDFPPSAAAISFYLSPKSQMVDFESLRKYPETSEVVLRDCVSLKSLEGLESLGSLKVLDIEGCSNVTSLGPLRGLGGLTMLDLSRTAITSLEPISEIPRFQSLFLRNCDSLESVGDQLPATRVVFGDCPSLKDYSFLSRSTDIRQLHLRSFHTPLPDLELPPNLGQLIMAGSHMPSLRGAPNVESLRFSGLLNLESVVSFIMDHYQVRNATASDFRQEIDFSALSTLSDHPTLNRFTLFSSGEKSAVPDIAGFRVERTRGRTMYVRVED